MFKLPLPPEVAITATWKQTTRGRAHLGAPTRPLVPCCVVMLRAAVLAVWAEPSCFLHVLDTHRASTEGEDVCGVLYGAIWRDACVFIKRYFVHHLGVQRVCC